MENAELLKQIDRAVDLAQQMRLSEAIALLQNVMKALPAREIASRGIDSRLDKIARDYELMTQYALEGSPDPSRADLLADAIEALTETAAWLRHLVRLPDTPTLYFSTIRTSRLANTALRTTIGRLRKTTDAISLAMMSGNDNPLDEATGRPLREEAEALSTALFNAVWTSYPLSEDDTNAVGEIMADPTLPTSLKDLIVGALTLGQLENHDDRRLSLLLDAYLDAERQTSLKAAVGLTIALWKANGRRLSRKTRAKLDHAKDTPDWEADIRAAIMNIIRSRDTERITRKIREELIPDLMKLSPELKKNLSKINSEADLMSLEENPEWEELLHSSGLEKRLKELSEIQEQGGDVMMGTFANLKTFPFFNDPANWFLPFSAQHSVVRASGINSSLAGILEHTTSLCDSDKFSFACSIGMIPPSQLAGMTQAFEAHASQMDEIESTMAAAGTESVRREHVVANYVRSLYRFFKLFRRKGEFTDIFAEDFNPALVSDLAPIVETRDMMDLIAEFYFRTGHWSDARVMFERLCRLDGPTAHRLQKIGYAFQQEGNAAAALEAYEQSELLDPESLWTLRRIAACARLTGDKEKALESYTRLSERLPEDAGVAINLGYALMALDRNDEAKKQFYKADYLDPATRRTRRPLARLHHLNGDFDKARALYDRILADEPSEYDYLASGHLKLLQSDFKGAVKDYANALREMHYDFERFVREFESDERLLNVNGISPDSTLRTIVMERAIFGSSTQGTNIKDHIQE